MKILLIKFGLQLLLMALDGPLRRSLNMLIDQYEVEAIPQKQKREMVAYGMAHEAGKRGIDIPERVANLAIEAELVRRRGVTRRYRGNRK